MRKQVKVDTPVLLLDHDGYCIETVFAGRWNDYTAWVLLNKDKRGHVGSVAHGWNRSYDNARRDAYEAYIEHKRLAVAKEEA